MQILVIDDETAVRQVLVSMARRGGYSVAEAAGGADALRILARGDIDVALCDIKMPDMNGIELVRQARASGIDTTFVMVTAFASMDTAVEALRAGAADYMVKPVGLEELIHRLKQIEALRGLRDENKTLRRFVMGNRDERFHFTCPVMQAMERQRCATLSWAIATSASTSPAR